MRLKPDAKAQAFAPPQLQNDILNCKSQLDIVDCFFEIVLPGFLVRMRMEHYLYNLLVIFIVFYEILLFCLNFLKFLKRIFDFFIFYKERSIHIFLRKKLEMPLLVEINQSEY